MLSGLALQKQAKHLKQRGDESRDVKGQRIASCLSKGCQSCGCGLLLAPLLTGQACTQVDLQVSSKIQGKAMQQPSRAHAAGLRDPSCTTCSYMKQDSPRNKLFMTVQALLRAVQHQAVCLARRQVPAVMSGTRSAMYMRRAADRLVVPSSQISLHRAATALSSSDLAMKAKGSTCTPHTSLVYHTTEGSAAASALTCPYLHSMASAALPCTGDETQSGFMQ